MELQNYERLRKDPTAVNNELVYDVIKIFENEKLIHKIIQKDPKVTIREHLNFIHNLR